MRRLLSLLVLGALIVLPACNDSGATAATINGQDISVSEVTEGARGFAQSALFRQSLSQRGVDLTPKGQVPTSFAAQWLSSLIQNEAIAQVAARRHIKASDREIDQAKSQYAGSDQNGQAYRQLPKFLRKQIIATTALQLALRSAIKPATPSDADLDAAYQQIAADCSRQKLVGHILVATEAEAQQASERLAAGESFATVAADASSDTGSSAQGGLLMCEGSAQWEQLDATFRAGAEATPVGEVSAPVQTQFGYHLIGAFPLSPETAQPMVAAAAQSADPLTEIVENYVKKAKIWVNPRFGTLERQGGSFTINPPTPTKPRNLPSETTSTTLPVTAPSTPSTTAPASSP